MCPENLIRKRRPRAAAEADIVIGLVNLMPHSAIRTAENLFRRLVSNGAPQQNIHWRLFAPHASAGQAYESLDDLWNAAPDRRPVDALIVSGTESQTGSMEDEALWPQLQKLCDWAGENTISTLWSCFSTHAAVLHIDGIRRERMPQKRSGVFQCRKTAGHFLSEGLPQQFLVPHSRYHDLPEAELRNRHYEILSHGPKLGVDSFSKQYGKSQFLFLQGHPEYSPHILLAEYCRDVRRFASGEHASYPNLPHNYFDKETVDILAMLRKQGVLSSNGLPPELVRSVMEKLTHPWRDSAQQLSAAWLRYVTQQKIRDWNQHLAFKHKAQAA